MSTVCVFMSVYCYMFVFTYVGTPRVAGMDEEQRSSLGSFFSDVGGDMCCDYVLLSLANE